MRCIERGRGFPSPKAGRSSTSVPIASRFWDLHRDESSDPDPCRHPAPELHMRSGSEEVPGRSRMELSDLHRLNDGGVPRCQPAALDSESSRCPPGIGMWAAARQGGLVDPATGVGGSDAFGCTSRTTNGRHQPPPTRPPLQPERTET